MRNHGTVFTLILLAWASSAAGQESAGLAPLPEGNTGIAAKYPGDQGIEKDPAVVFADGFESGDIDKWDTSYHYHKITHEPENVHSGKSALEFTLAWPRPGGSSNGGLSQSFRPGYDLLFLRYYAKFGKDTELFHGGTHNGAAIFGQGPDVDGVHPGIRADGRNQFTARLDTATDGRHPFAGPLGVLQLSPGTSNHLRRSTLSLRPDRAEAKAAGAVLRQGVRVAARFHSEAGSLVLL